MTKLREVRPEDAPALAALWQRVFHDDPASSETFLRLLPELGGGVAAFEGGVPVGAAYIVTALQLREAEKSRRCGYLYAVAVDEARRGEGLGAALSQAAAELGRARGAELICTWPAEPGLYGWYERVLGAHCGLYLKSRDFDSAALFPVRRLSSEDYGLRREALLSGRPHLFPEPAALRFEETNCRIYGGGLFAVGGGLAAASVDGDLTVVRELLGAPEEAAASLGAALGTAKVRLWSPAPSGEPFLVFTPNELSPDTVWNLAFE